MVVDCHVHLIPEKFGGYDNGKDILESMDKAGIDKIFLFSPVPRELEFKGKYVVYRESLKEQRESIKKVAEIVAEDPQRLIGFAWIDPCLSDAEHEVERAIVDYGLRGIKMIPYQWYPYEERLFPVYRKIQDMGVPIIFHSGISFTGGDCSRFCRPTFYEVLLHFPEIKFALAHVGWPWTDECIATAARFQAALEEAKLFAPKLAEEQEQRSAAHREDSKPQMYIDITPGTPLVYRTEVLRRAITVLGADRLVYGSDTFTYPPEMTEQSKKVLVNDRRRFDEELGLSKVAQDKILGENAIELLRH